MAMRAALMYGARDVRVEDLPRPEPGPGEVLLRVQAVGICGSDLHYYREGRIGTTAITSPLVLGHEFSAVVVENRSGVPALTPGRLVAVDPARPCGSCEWCRGGDPNLCPATQFAGSPGCLGGLAEYHVAPAEAAVLVPPGMDAVTAALLEPLGVAIHALDLARLQPMETVAILGAGPIGLLLMLVARASGAGRVFLVDPLEYRAEAGRRLGADEAGAEVGAVTGWTGGRGVDVVLEATNSPAAPGQAIDAARIGGRVILVGIPDGDAITLQASEARRKALVLKFARRMGHVYPRAVEMARTGRVQLDAIVSHRVPLDRTPEAFARQNGYRDGALKTMIMVTAEM
jgi:L-iditol 2-dehydrogenase